jgi:hypothetical protein
MRGKASQRLAIWSATHDPVMLRFGSFIERIEENLALYVRFQYFPYSSSISD